MTVISNTTVIANFAVIGQIDALRRLFGTLYISSEVYGEARAGVDEGYSFYSGLDQALDASNPDGWLRLTSVAAGPEMATYVTLPRRLHGGEASCLAIARHRGWLLMTDDHTARRQARDMGIRLTGTLGCLVLMVQRGLVQLGEANAWLKAMTEHNYRCPVDRLDDLVAE
jgi:predicted nucleic acid-binding protein